MGFDAERAGFRAFRDSVAQRPGALRELEASVAEVFRTYDTVVRENRFIVGGVIEFLLGCALRAAGVPVQHKGASTTDIDLRLDGAEGGFSVKAILRGRATNLVNVRGGSAGPDRWRSATLFLISGGLGIVYADPALPWWVAHRDRALRATSDALEVTRRAVEEFAGSEPEWRIPCEFPASTSRGDPGAIRIASADVAATVLVNYPSLHAEFPGLRPGEETRRR